jgi:hypothetical protein
MITLKDCQSSKETFKPKGVTSGACLRAHRKQKVGDDQIGEPDVIEHAEQRGTECQVGIQRLARQGKKQP